ncbi:MAG TPA: zinc ribbon domain-containing protein [Ktedonobacteraceae bacterium]|nr:zinc ribbon domain-containing protein [Ktedonobacteraceae bacterium]
MEKLANFRYYNKKTLLALIIAYAANLLLMLVPIAMLGSFSGAGSNHVDEVLNALINIGILIFIIQVIFVMVYDWSGAVTLRGWTQSRIMRESLLADLKMFYVLLYLFFPEIMLPIYLARIVADRRREEERKQFERQRYIAAMEAQLGIVPPTKGMCRVCQKPLQLGAEFCQYCRAPVVEHPKVCPQCATTTLPDAQWCPKCGKLLR